MKKTQSTKLAALKLKKEIVIQLDTDQLKAIVGGVPSRMTPSQCPTNCF